MGQFIQIIEFDTSHIDEVRALGDEFRRQREGETEGVSPVRVTLTEDRDHPGHFLNIVEFPSYDEAMENSNRPDTQVFADKLAALCDAPPRFHNLDVADGWSR